MTLDSTKNSRATTCAPSHYNFHMPLFCRHNEYFSMSTLGRRYSLRVLWLALERDVIVVFKTTFSALTVCIVCVLCKNEHIYDAVIPQTVKHLWCCHTLSPLMPGSPFSPGNPAGPYIKKSQSQSAISRRGRICCHPKIICLLFLDQYLIQL